MHFCLRNNDLDPFKRVVGVGGQRPDGGRRGSCEELYAEAGTHRGPQHYDKLDSASKVRVSGLVKNWHFLEDGIVHIFTCV